MTEWLIFDFIKLWEEKPVKLCYMPDYVVLEQPRHGILNHFLAWHLTCCSAWGNSTFLNDACLLLHGFWSQFTNWFWYYTRAMLNQVICCYGLRTRGPLKNCRNKTCHHCRILTIECIFHQGLIISFNISDMENTLITYFLGKKNLTFGFNFSRVRHKKSYCPFDHF